MLVKLRNPFLLTKAVEIISDIVTEIKIKVNEFGLSVIAMDPANVAMIAFKLPKSSFSEFDVESETLGINPSDLKKILKRAGVKSTLTLEKRDNKLNIQIEDKILRNFSLTLIDINSEDKSLPSLEFSSKVTLNSNDFIESLEDCMVVSNSCSLSTKDGKFIIESKGLNSARSEFSGDEAEIESGDCESRYSLEYIQKFIKAIKLGDRTVISFAKDHPLKIDVSESGLEMNFILAPRVENDY